jgi:hypothetical protein
MHPGSGPLIRGPAAELAIFDIDGPVTAPQSRTIEQHEILDLTIEFITKRGYVAYNTGRASAIAHQRVISPLLARARARGIDQESFSRRISVFAEKGAVTSFWDDGRGEWSHRIDPATVVPASLREEIADLLRGDAEFRTYIFYDRDKKTMVSVEMRHETPGPAPVPVTPAVFRPVAERFAAGVRRLAKEQGYEDIEVDCTTIAVDIQRPRSGKELGTRLAFDWVREMGARVERVHCFGDSRSDVAMAIEAHSIMSRWFADAGERVVIDGAFTMQAFPGTYGRGTVAYLRSLAN